MSTVWYSILISSIKIECTKNYVHLYFPKKKSPRYKALLVSEVDIEVFGFTALVIFEIGVFGFCIHCGFHFFFPL